MQHLNRILKYIFECKIPLIGIFVQQICLFHVPSVSPNIYIAVSVSRRSSTCFTDSHICLFHVDVTCFTDSPNTYLPAAYCCLIMYLYMYIYIYKQWCYKLICSAYTNFNSGQRTWSGSKVDKFIHIRIF